MKAVFVEKYGGPDDLVVKEIDRIETIGANDVRVEIKARGIAFSDTLVAAGQYQVKSEPPFFLGNEAAGYVTEIGSSVTEYQVGDAVLTSAGCIEEAVIDVNSLTLIPEGVDLELAAGFRSNYQTALYGMQRARLKAGETLLIHGAAGGVGLAAVDIGKLMGATVIATAGTDEKLDIVKSISFEIPKGKTVALVGESGSGKTTISEEITKKISKKYGDTTVSYTHLTLPTNREV